MDIIQSSKVCWVFLESLNALELFEAVNVSI